MQNYISINKTFQKATPIFREIVKRKFPNHKIASRFVSFSDTSHPKSTLTNLKKKGKYGLSFVIQSPSLNHVLWFAQTELLLNLSDSIFDHPNFEAKSFSWGHRKSRCKGYCQRVGRCKKIGPHTYLITHYFARHRHFFKFMFRRNMLGEDGKRRKDGRSRFASWRSLNYRNKSEHYVKFQRFQKLVETTQ